MTVTHPRFTKANKTPSFLRALRSSEPTSGGRSEAGQMYVVSVCVLCVRVRACEAQGKGRDTGERKRGSSRLPQSPCTEHAFLTIGNLKIYKWISDKESMFRFLGCQSSNKCVPLRDRQTSVFRSGIIKQVCSAHSGGFGRSGEEVIWRAHARVQHRNVH